MGTVSGWRRLVPVTSGRHVSPTPRPRSNLSRPFLTTISLLAGRRHPPGPVPAILAGMDDPPEQYVFRDARGGKYIFAGETLEYMQCEALRLGMTLDQLWDRIVEEEGERIRRHLEKN
jgi:hypothetical protein